MTKHEKNSNAGSFLSFGIRHLDFVIGMTRALSNKTRRRTSQAEPNSFAFNSFAL
jgi:hypothetical protein